MKSKFTYLTISLFFLSTLLSTSCNQEDDCFMGTVRFTNTSNNPYRIYLNGDYEMQLPGNTFTEIELIEGSYNLKAEQVSGYILYPTVKQTELHIFGCDEKEWVFP